MTEFERLGFRQWYYFSFDTKEETEQWLNRLAMGLPTQHATAVEAHNRLMLTKAFDLSARLKRAIPLPIAASDAKQRQGPLAAE